MPWPCPQDYNEAIQNPSVAFIDQELRASMPELNALELPRAISGGFASVYKMKSPARALAVRCFLREVDDLPQRYRHITSFIQKAQLPYLLPIEFIEEGILILGQRYPVLKMPWVEGETLDQFIWRNLQNGEALRILSDKFERMIAEFAECNIAHGDLQHGNVLIVDGEIVLVDYDGMFVPALTGLSGNELGHRNYQHPMRCAEDFGPSLDNYSARVIVTSLRSIAEDPGLWEKLGGGDECLLFKDVDYKLPLLSRSFYMLEKHDNDLIASQASQLRCCLGFKPQQVPVYPSVLDTSELLDIDAYTGFSGFWNSDEDESEEESSAMPGEKAKPEPQRAAHKPPVAPASANNSFDVLMNQGIYQSEVDNYAQASRYFIRALQIDPDSADAYRQLGFAHLETGKHGIAVSNFSAALRMNDADAIALAGRALAQLQTKRFGMAQADADQSLRVKPENNPLALRVRAIIRAELNRFQEAMQDIDTALSMAPRDAQCYCARGTIRQKMGRHAPAIADFDAAAKLKPTLGRAYMGRAQSHRELGQISRAMEDLSTATKLMPLDADLHYAYGEVLTIQRHFDQAMEAFQKGLSLDELNPQKAWLRIAQAHWNKHEYGQAGVLLQRVAERDPGLLSKLDPNLVAAARGFRNLEQDQVDGAIQTFDGLLQGRFPMSEAYLGRGIARYRKRDFAGALADFNHIAASEVLDVQGLLWSSICKTRMFHLQDALSRLKAFSAEVKDLPLYRYAGGLLQVFTEQFDKASRNLERCGEFEDASYWLQVSQAMLLFAAHKDKQALRLLEDALMEKEESVVVAAVAEVLVANKRFKEAERILRSYEFKSLDRCPQYHYWRGVCLLQLSKASEAQEQFSEALAICPHYDRAVQAQNSLIQIRQ